MCGNWDVAAGDTVDLRNAAANAVSSGSYSSHAAAGTKIGSARVRYIGHESGTVGSSTAQYRMYLYDITIDSGYNFDNIKSVYYNTTAKGHADVVLEDGIAVLKETKYNKLLFRLPTSATKTLKPGINQVNNFEYTKQFSASIASASNDVVISVSGDETFPYTIGTLSATEINNNILLALTEAATINSVNYAAGTILDLTASGCVLTNTGTQLTISLPGTSGATAANVRVLAKVAASGVDPVTKVIKPNAVVVINTHTGNADGTYSLGVSDGWKLKHVYIGAYDDDAADVVSAGDDIASEFTFDNGQRDNFYANCRIVKKATSSQSLVDSKLVVVFDYFEHNGSPATNYNFYGVDSYPVDDTGATEDTIHTYEIPVYTSQVTGESFDLRNTLDFRPRFDTTITYTTSPATADATAANVNPTSGSTPSGPQGGAIITPVPTEQFTTDIEYYMGRKDRVVVDGEGNFSIVSGVPSLSPVEAVEPDTVMSLAVITIPPYPSLAPNVAKSISRPNLGISFKLTDNRRYTMRDIGVIEQRINRLEYYSALTLLEKSAKDMVIPSAVDATLDRFKSGILVDAFTGHNIGNVKSSEYHCSIDPDNRESRPFFFLENVDLQYNTNNSSNMVKTGDLLTLPYTSVRYASNPYAVKPRNCVGDLLFNYVGDIALDPPVDNWVDTNTLPDITANFDGNYDAWENMADAWGTQWGDWQDVGTGKVISETSTTAISSINQASSGATVQGSADLQIVTTTTEQRQSRQGIKVSVTPETQTQRTGARVTNTSIVPYMRTITVKFSATRLKPKTRVYPFFDRVLVQEHCRPLPIGAINTNSTTNSDWATWRDYSNFGDALITDEYGRLCGEFRIPQGVFRVGEKIFRLCDDIGNRDTFVTTVATQTFSSNGLAQNVQDTIVSTRVAKVAANSVSNARF